jgi:DNA-binding FrmR family transcriptional regulator
MKETIDNTRNLVELRQIEKQIHGIQKMIEDRESTFDILTQVHSVKRALITIEDKILTIYLQSHIVEAEKQTPEKKQKTIDEILNLIQHASKG